MYWHGGGRTCTNACESMFLARVSGSSFLALLHDCGPDLGTTIARKIGAGLHGANIKARVGSAARDPKTGIDAATQLAIDAASNAAAD